VSYPLHKNEHQLTKEIPKQVFHFIDQQTISLDKTYSFENIT